MTAVPDVGGNSVTIMRMRVDFPAPLGPSSPKISPGATAKEMPSTAVKSPKRLTMLRTSIAPVMLGSPLPDPRSLIPVPRSQFPVSRYSFDWQQHVRGHADGQAPVGVVESQPDLEGLDVALRPADVTLRGEAGVRAAVDHRTLP